MVDGKQECATAPHIIIPMAGHGKRFKEQGFQMDKPMIPVGGRLMLDWVLDTLPREWRERIVAVTREDQAGLRDSLWDWMWNGNSAANSEISSVVITGPTQGAACTVLAAAVGLPPDEPVIVMNADQWVRINPKDDKGLLDNDLADIHSWAMSVSLDGLILTFPGTGPQWSYAVLNGYNRVVHVIEKKEVSKYATCGVYWWRRAGDLVHSICAMVASEQKTNGEFYLAPSMNFLPLSEKRVQIIEVNEFYGLGTPEQVKEFEALLATGWRA